MSKNALLAALKNILPSDSEDDESHMMPPKGAKVIDITAVKKLPMDDEEHDLPELADHMDMPDDLMSEFGDHDMKEPDQGGDALHASVGKLLQERDPDLYEELAQHLGGDR
jgi:hypothetical protein